MIDTISNLVRYIVILLFLTVILEMILPQGTFRRYLRVIVGILLIFTILSPLQKIMHIAPHWDEEALLSGAGISGGSLDQVLAQGEELHEEKLQLALHDYRGNIFTLLEGELGSKFSKRLLQLDFSPDENSSSDKFGTVQELFLIVKEAGETPPPGKEMTRVQKVSIQIMPSGKQEDIPAERLPLAKNKEIQAEEKAIAEYLASLLQLPLENVRVEIAGQ